MISRIKLKFGKAVGLPAEEIELSPITIFVGPNNSGKSRVLSEISFFARQGRDAADHVILDRASFNGMTVDEAEQAIVRLEGTRNEGEHLSAGDIILASRHGRFSVRRDKLKSIVQNPSQNLEAYSSWFLAHLTLQLDGLDRIRLVDPQQAGDLQRPSHSTFQTLFRDNDKREIVRRIIHEAFGSYFVIDPTNLSQLRIRLSPRPPTSEIEERGIHQDAQPRYRLKAPAME